MHVFVFLIKVKRLDFFKFSLEIGVRKSDGKGRKKEGEELSLSDEYSLFQLFMSRYSAAYNT